MAIENRPGISKLAQKRMTRRSAIKIGGLTAVGLAFSKPVISTLRPPPVWASVSPGTGGGPPSPTIIEVKNSDLVGPTDAAPGWRYVDEGTAGSVGAFVAGPGTPPQGSGSARFLLSAASQGLILINYTAGLVGLAFSNITTLGYYTYVTSAPGVQAPSLQVNVDADVTDGDTSYQGRLIFEPYQNGTVVPGTWQYWDTLSGDWWATGAPIVSDAPQSSPLPLSTIKTLYPNVGINSSFGGLLVKAGSGWSSFDGNVDGITLGVNGSDVIYDFEV